jgi:hypothetical protein
VPCLITQRQAEIIPCVSTTYKKHKPDLGNASVGKGRLNKTCCNPLQQESLTH